MIIKSGYQTSVFLKCLGMCESSTFVYACVNHSSRFAEISSNPHKKSKFSPLLCCAKQKKEEEKISSTPCIGRTGEVWENNLRSLSRLLLMASTSSSSQLCLSGGWTGLYSLHKKMCAADFTSNILSLLPQSFLFFHATQRMFCCLKYFFIARPKAHSRQQNWRACSTR